MWAAETYRDIINDRLGYRDKRRPRGAMQSLAKRLGCHPTFVAQVLKERADLSLEQGYAVAAHFEFTAEERDFFLTMIQRDRAGNKELRSYFQNKLNLMSEAKRDLKEAVKSKNPSLGAFELEYFGNWFYQVVHAYTQIPHYQTVAAIAKVSGRSNEDVQMVLERLEEMKLVKRERSTWQSTLHFLHLPKSSHFIRNLHATWKAKLLADIQTSGKLDGTRYSGLITVGEKEFAKVREILVRATGEIRNTVETSKPTEVYILSMDCYKI